MLKVKVWKKDWDKKRRTEHKERKEVE
jgi:hypothetical protein